MKLGERLKIEDFEEFVLGKKSIEIPSFYWKKVQKSNKFLQTLLKEGKAYYGINTGFGKLANTSIGKNELNKLQQNLILSHASGVGDDLPLEIVKGAMLLRLVCFLKGMSGVREYIVRMLHTMIKNEIIPAVPSKGSVGASGDLAPSAHLALVLLGKGFAYYKGRKMKGNEALKKIGLKPIKLEAKEGLSLINGTQFMTSIAAISLIRIKKLINYADYTAAASIECIGGRKDPFHQGIQKARPYKGQKDSAQNILTLLKGSKIERTRRVQDPYSFRCSPQVHGAIRDVISFCENVIETEMNSVTDNPLLINDKVLSGGNFHGEPIAFALDFMKIALAELSSISERRTAHLMDPEITGLEPFLTKSPGLNSGYMLTHTTAASLVSRNKTLAYPSVVDSIPTSLNQEDHVSMGMNGALFLLEVVDNATYVIAIELITATQALRMKGLEKTAPGIKQFLKPVLNIVPPYKRDREHYNDIKGVRELILKGKL
ncbi:MAG: histidine ammonia-lyase [Candidatus Stahlbacteria bacterium]|nr:MAG: histidine ammonia-lyase [Candidatus Stahlbacteria bacterium]